MYDSWTTNACLFEWLLVTNWFDFRMTDVELQFPYLLLDRFLVMGGHGLWKWRWCPQWRHGSVWPILCTVQVHSHKCRDVLVLHSWIAESDIRFFILGKSQIAGNKEAPHNRNRCRYLFSLNPVAYYQILHASWINGRIFIPLYI